MNLRYKLMKFMSGRYGLDALFYVLFAISAVLVVVNMFVGSIILQLVIDAIMIYAFYRVLSRNIAARRRENLLVTGLAHEIKKRRSIRRQRRADYTHIYKKCPRCHGSVSYETAFAGYNAGSNGTAAGFLYFV